MSFCVWYCVPLSFLLLFAVLVALQYGRGETEQTAFAIFYFSPLLPPSCFGRFCFCPAHWHGREGSNLHVGSDLVLVLPFSFFLSFFFTFDGAYISTVSCSATPSLSLHSVPDLPSFHLPYSGGWGGVSLDFCTTITFRFSSLFHTFLSFFSFVLSVPFLIHAAPADGGRKEQTKRVGQCGSSLGDRWPTWFLSLWKSVLQRGEGRGDVRGRVG